MSTYRVLSPLSHDMVYYAEGSLIDGSLLSEGQAEALVAVKVLAPVVVPAEPAPALASGAETGAASDAEPVSAPEASIEPAEAAETAEEQPEAPEAPVEAVEAVEAPEADTEPETPEA